MRCPVLWNMPERLSSPLSEKPKAALEEPAAGCVQFVQGQGVLSPGVSAGSGGPSGHPAFSSVVGRVNLERYGLTVHQAAALVLARRLLGCSERIPRRRVCPAGNGVHIAFTVPVRKRVARWTHWGAVSGQLRGACSAAPAGVREATPIRFRLSTGLRPGWWLERVISSVFPGEIPGRSRLALLGRRGFPLPGSVTGKADRGLVTKVNLFYNGES